MCGLYIGNLYKTLYNGIIHTLRLSDNYMHKQAKVSIWSDVDLSPIRREAITWIKTNSWAI